MAGPLITAARNRLAANHPIAAAVAQGVRNAAARPDTATTASDETAVTAEVTAAMAASPVVQNAMNQEPWWKSRIWVGLITSAFGVLLARLNVQFTANEQAFINQITPYVPQGLGLAIAAVGRAVGGRKGPINWRHPWTILGVGR